MRFATGPTRDSPTDRALSAMGPAYTYCSAYFLRPGKDHSQECLDSAEETERILSEEGGNVS